MLGFIPQSTFSTSTSTDTNSTYRNGFGTYYHFTSNLRRYIQFLKDTIKVSIELYFNVISYHLIKLSLSVFFVVFCSFYSNIKILLLTLRLVILDF